LTELQWNTIELAWIANMHTVLLNPEFNPTIIDRDLLRSIAQYKRWFIIFFCKGQKTSRGIRLINLDKGIKALKLIAGYMQYLCCYDAASENREPPGLPFWKGWDPVKRELHFQWFGGHLKKFRDCYRKVSDQELVALCQMRTFGRALPCPSRRVCADDLIDQVKILTKERIIEDSVLDAIEDCADRLGRRWRIHDMPKMTHLSISTSGCFEVSSKNGGNAAYVRDNYIKYLDTQTSKVKLVWGKYSMPVFEAVCHSDFPEPVWVLTDVWGQPVFPAHLNNGVNRRIPYCLERSGDDITLMSVIYRRPKMGRRGLFLETLFQGKLGEPIPNEVGQGIALLAAAEAALQGRFETLDGNTVEPDAFLVFEDNFRIPLFQGYRVLRYKVVDPPQVNLTCLSEPGGKARTLGVNQTWFIIIGRMMRQWSEPIVARDGRARIGLRSTNKMWSFLRYLQRMGRDSSVPDTIWCQSTDYRASTDYIPLSVISRLWKGLTRSLDRRHPFLVFFDLIVSNRRLGLLDFKNLFETFDSLGIDMIHRCGSFMGEPMSFMTLNVSNIIIDEISDYIYSHPGDKDLHLFRNVPEPRPEPAAICGDDFASLRTDLRRIREFKDFATRFGMVFSWKDQVSKRLLIFCEEHILITQDRKASYVDVIKSRLLTPMTRLHGNHQSAILGKGRALSNQVRYLENKALESCTITIYLSIFDRYYGYILSEIGLPIYLPPNCGGLGVPIAESDIPDFLWKYIKHIFDVLSDKNQVSRWVRLAELSALTLPNKKGIQTWDHTLQILEKVYKDYTVFEYKDKVQLSDPLKGDTLYPDQFVVDLIEIVTGAKIPINVFDPSEFEWDALNNEARQLGFVQASSIPDEVERVCNFQTFLRKPETASMRSLHSWSVRSKKYWNMSGIKPDRKTKVLRKDVPSFKSIADLERRVRSTIPGWVFRTKDIVNIHNSGASLYIDFSQTRKFRIEQERKKTSVGDLVSQKEENPSQAIGSLVRFNKPK
jgi:hypothetical protein